MVTKEELRKRLNLIPNDKQEKKPNQSREDVNASIDFPSPANAPISERDTGNIEKEKSKLIAQGFSEKQAEGIVLQGREITGQGVAVNNSLTTEQAQQNQAQLQTDLGRQGVFEQPKLEQLNPTQLDTTQQKVGFFNAIIGGTIANDLLPKDLFNSPEFGAMDEIQKQEFFRNAAKKEIQKEIITKNLTATERAGAIFEAIPVVGGLARKYVSSLATPSSKVDSLVSEIDNEKERAVNLGSSVSSGYVDGQTALDTLDEIGKNLDVAEARIKRLAIVSSILRQNPEQLDEIESKIIRARERVQTARVQAAGGQLTEPTDVQLFQVLQEVKGG